MRERLGPEAGEAARIHADGYKEYLQKGVELGERIISTGKDIMRRLKPIKEGKPLLEQEMSLLDKTMLDFMDDSRKRVLILLESHTARVETKRLFAKALANQWFGTDEEKLVRSVVALLEHSFQIEQMSIHERRAQTLAQAIWTVKNEVHDFIGKHTDELLQQKWLLVAEGKSR